ncbi:MAG: phasin family protein [Candidatus Competibacteraceae bacterium]
MKHDTQIKIPESVTEPRKDAVDRAREEIGGRVDSLAKEGEKLRDQTLKLAESTANEARERVDEVRGMVEGLKSRAADTLDNLEQWDDWVGQANALHHEKYGESSQSRGRRGMHEEMRPP